MEPSTSATAPEAIVLTDAQIVTRVLAGERELFELLMRRHNRRVYRAIRSILRNDTEAEDAMQEAYVQAFQHLDQFDGRSAVSTWLVRIAINAALARKRGQNGRLVLVDDRFFEGAPMNRPDAEHGAAMREATALLETAVDSLPATYRTVFMLREIEELNTAETAAALDVTEELVKTRLHRAKAALRERLLELAGAASSEAFGFEAPRCNLVVDAVMKQILATR